MNKPEIDLSDFFPRNLTGKQLADEMRAKLHSDVRDSQSEATREYVCVCENCRYYYRNSDEDNGNWHCVNSNVEAYIADSYFADSYFEPTADYYCKFWKEI